MPPSLRLVDDAGVRWRVVDTLHVPQSDALAPRFTPGSEPHATSRLFARRSPVDGGWDVYSVALMRDDRRSDLSRATLLRQLAVAGGPAPRPGESCTDYLARLRRVHPASFLPPAWPRPLPPIPRRGWSPLAPDAASHAW